MNRVSLSGVSVCFGRVHALDGVQVEVQQGQAMMLAGPNGAGKSTLIQVLLGLVRPSEGSLNIDGKPRTVDNDFKRQLGYLPEAVAFAENLSGRQALKFFAMARGITRRRVDAVLERIGLAHAASRRVRGYSRGMKQRLGLGVAILGEPSLLILDEPTGGLDQEGLQVLWSVLAEWREAGRMVLLASHDLALLERRVDRVSVLKQGRVCATGTPSELRSQAELPVRVSFHAGNDAGKWRELKAALSRWGYGTTISIGDDRIVVDVSPSTLLSLMDLRASFPGAVDAVRVEEPGLDLVYEKLLEEAA